MRRILGIKHLGLIVTGAAVSAAATLFAIVTMVLPILCPDGLSADRCLVSDPVPVTTAPPVATEDDAGDPVAEVTPPPIPRIPTVVPPRPAAPQSASPTPRIVKTIPIRPTSFPVRQPAEVAEPPSSTGTAPDTAESAAPADETPANEPEANDTPEAPVPAPASDRPAETEAASPPADDSTLTTRSDVNVRSGPSLSSGRLFSLPAGETVSPGAKQRGWVEVTDSEGRTGWAHESFLE